MSYAQRRQGEKNSKIICCHSQSGGHLWSREIPPWSARILTPKVLCFLTPPNSSYLYFVQTLLPQSQRMRRKRALKKDACSCWTLAETRHLGKECSWGDGGQRPTTVGDRPDAMTHRALLVEGPCAGRRFRSVVPANDPHVDAPSLDLAERDRREPACFGAVTRSEY